MNPGQVVGPRVVLVLGGEIVTQGAKDAEAAEGAEHGHLRGLIEEAVGWGDTKSGGRGRAVAMRALHGTGKADAGVIPRAVAVGVPSPCAPCMERVKLMRASFTRVLRKADVRLRLPTAACPARAC